MKGSPISLSVVVPVRNGQLTVPLRVQRLQPVLVAPAKEYELVLVNDGSQDGSWTVIEQLAQANPWARGLNLMRSCRVPPALLNTCLRWVFAAETPLGLVLPFPGGTSILAVLPKPL